MSVVATTNKQYSVEYPVIIRHWPKTETVNVPREVEILDQHFGIVRTDDTATDYDAKPVLLETQYQLTKYGKNLHYPAYDPWHKDFMWAAVMPVNFYRAEPTKKLYDVIHLSSGYALTRVFKNKAKPFIQECWKRRITYVSGGLFTLDSGQIQSKIKYDVKVSE
jgi:hypothetical protein